MSATNKTTNYELPQFISTDKPTWLTDVNGAFATIDSQMKSNHDLAETANTSASTAQSTAETASATASTASTNASTALSTAQTAESNASTALSTAQSASSDASTALSTANTASTNASTALSTANTASSTASSAQSDATNALTKANTLISDFNISTRTSAQCASFMPSATGITYNGNVVLLDSTTSQLFKFYGSLEIVATDTASIGLSSIPKGDSDVQLYGIDTGLSLTNAPSGSYVIEGAGIATIWASSSYTFLHQIAVGANGHIYLYPDTSNNNVTFYNGDTTQVNFTANLYINSNFGDTPTPTPNA